MIEFLISIDKQLLLFLNGLHSDFFDSVFWVITQKETWIPLYLFVLVALIIKYKWQAIPLIVLIIVCIVATDQSSVFLKNTVGRLRPSYDPDTSPFVHLVNNYKGGPYSFVSSHATNAFGFGVLAALLIKNRVFTFVVLGMAAINSYSRIYLGVHFPGDIVAGAILGSVIGAVLFYGYKSLAKKVFNWSI